MYKKINSSLAIFYYDFPLLGVKFAGYQLTVRYRDAFDIHKLVQKYGEPLLEEQKKNLPLTMSIEPFSNCGHPFLPRIIRSSVTAVVITHITWIQSTDSQTSSTKP